MKGVFGTFIFTNWEYEFDQSHGIFCLFRLAIFTLMPFFSNFILFVPTFCYQHLNCYSHYPLYVCLQSFHSLGFLIDSYYCMYFYTHRHQLHNFFLVFRLWIFILGLSHLRHFCLFGMLSSEDSYYDVEVYEEVVVVLICFWDCLCKGWTIGLIIARSHFKRKKSLRKINF